MKYPDIDPVALSLGPLEIGDKVIGPINVHWYGIMYLFAFATAWALASYRCRQPHSPLTKNQVEDLIFYGALGVILGGRFGYVMFYNFERWLEEPLWLLKVWEGGMSFHGGLLGVALAMVLYAKRINKPVFALGDFVAPIVPLGLGFGRIGNFIGQELWGRQTDLPWGMVFPKDSEALTRHPSQLYQAALEVLVLFIILFWFSRKPRPRASVSGLFLVLYGLFRFIVEFVREPDEHLAEQLLFGWMTRGQTLSIPMVVVGVAMIVWAYKSQPSAEASNSNNNSKNKQKQAKTSKNRSKAS